MLRLPTSAFAVVNLVREPVKRILNKDTEDLSVKALVCAFNKEEALLLALCNFAKVR